MPKPPPVFCHCGHSQNDHGWQDYVWGPCLVCTECQKYDPPEAAKLETGVASEATNPAKRADPGQAGPNA